jgi:hypothetical protein
LLPLIFPVLLASGFFKTTQFQTITEFSIKVLRLPFELHLLYLGCSPLLAW